MLWTFRLRLLKASVLKYFKCLLELLQWTDCPMISSSNRFVLLQKLLFLRSSYISKFKCLLVHLFNHHLLHFLSSDYTSLSDSGIKKRPQIKRWYDSYCIMLYNIVRFKPLIQLLGSQIHHLPFIIIVFPYCISSWWLQQIYLVMCIYRNISVFTKMMAVSR